MSVSSFFFFPVPTQPMNLIQAKVNSAARHIRKVLIGGHVVEGRFPLGQPAYRLVWPVGRLQR